MGPNLPGKQPKIPGILNGIDANSARGVWYGLRHAGRYENVTFGPEYYHLLCMLSALVFTVRYVEEGLC